MKKTINVKVPTATYNKMLSLIEKANDGFSDGTITTADIVQNALDCAQIDIEALRKSKTSIKKMLRNVIQNSEDLSVEDLIRKLQEVQGTGQRKEG